MKILIILFLCVFCFQVSAQQAIVADLKVQGNKKLKSSFIHKLSKVKPGVAFDSTMIEEDIKRLKRLPSIAHAYYQIFPTEKDGEYNVFYTIDENFTIIPSVNVYTTNEDEFAYRLGLYEFNLFGQNISFGGFYQKDIYSSYGINFRAPYLFSRNFGLAVNHQDLTTQEPVFFNNSTSDYKYNNTSYEILGLYEFNFKNRIELDINYFTEDYQYKFGATSPDVPQALNVHKLLYKGIYAFNTLDYDYQYVSGFKNMFQFQYVTTRDKSLPGFLIVGMICYITNGLVKKEIGQTDYDWAWHPMMKRHLRRFLLTII